ncbi:glycosyltransferase [Oligoflexus tunisiensis]|uniref:glycosyltransferase n=1 Tax=Oligoflexus tunisiensis TaxID=708132 RepID=UPI00114C9FDB|nr:glycosyltransferase [Oligoflexus tunisiensis]
MNKRVLLMITRPEIGGATRNVRDLALKLHGSGFKVMALSSEKQGWLVDELLKSGIPYVHSSLFKARIAPLYDILFVMWLIRFLRKQDIDVLHIHSSKAGILGRIAGKLSGVRRIIFSVHGVSFQRQIPLLPRLLYMIAERFAYWMCDAIVCVSGFDYGRYVDLLGDPQGKVQTIHNELLDFTPQARVPNIMPVFGFLGRLAYQKDPQLFVHSLIRLYELTGISFSAVIKGGGELQEELKCLVHNSRLHNRINFEAEDDRVSEFLARVDVLVMTSRFEGYPYTLLEGRAAGCYLVASDVGGCREIINDESVGLLFTQGSVESCAQALKKSIGQLKQDTLSQRGNEYQTYFLGILRCYDIDLGELGLTNEVHF